MQARWGRMAALAAAAAGLAASVLLVTLLVLQPVPSAAGPGRYMLVIDAGSSGTRIHAYAWGAPAPPGGVPLLVALPPSAAPHKLPKSERQGLYNRVETQTGVHTFVGDAAGLRAHALQPLLDWAAAAVPRALHAHTPLVFLATGGTRRLPPHKQEVLMTAVRQVLQASGFRFHASWARVISGPQEGVYGWVALNYPVLQRGQGGRMANADATLAALDLGGSTLEVTYELPPSSDHTPLHVTVAGVAHALYTHTFKHYGLNEAWDRAITELMRQQLGPAAVEDTDAPHAPRIATQLSSGSTTTVSSTIRSSASSSSAGNSSVVAGSISSLAGSTAAPSVDDAGVGWPPPDAAAAAPLLAGRRRRRLHRHGGRGGTLSLQAPTAARDSASTQPHAARRQRLAAAAVSGGDAPVVRHPCVHAGLRERYERTTVTRQPLHAASVLLEGAPDWQRCRELMQSVVNASSRCSGHAAGDLVCRLGSLQPPKKGKYMALAGFYVVWKFFDLPEAGGVADLLPAAQRLCQRPWEEVHRDLGHMINVERYCAWAPYVVSLLEQGLQLHSEDVQIGAGDVGWPLGAALVEGSKLPDLMAPAPAPAARSPRTTARLRFDANAVRALAVVLVLLGVVVVWLLVRACCPSVQQAMYRELVPAGAQLASEGSGAQAPTLDGIVVAHSRLRGSPSKTSLRL